MPGKRLSNCKGTISEGRKLIGHLILVIIWSPEGPGKEIFPFTRPHGTVGIAAGRADDETDRQISAAARAEQQANAIVDRRSLFASSSAQQAPAKQNDANSTPEVDAIARRMLALEMRKHIAGTVSASKHEVATSKQASQTNGARHDGKGSMVVETALDGTDAPSCRQGHSMHVSLHVVGPYKAGYFCDKCNASSAKGHLGGSLERWFCAKCHHDLCFECHPRALRGVSNMPAAAASTTKPARGTVVAAGNNREQGEDVDVHTGEDAYLTVDGTADGDGTVDGNGGADRSSAHDREREHAEERHARNLPYVS
jgi:hypothetical protein